MSTTTLREFIASLESRFPQAAALVDETRFDMNDREWEGLLWKPLSAVAQRLCEIVVFQSRMDVLDYENAPSEEEELRGMFEFEKKSGLLEDDEQDFETYFNSWTDRNSQRQKKAAEDHLGLQQLEAALREHGIEVALDRPLGVCEYVLAEGIARPGFGGTLRFDVEEE